MRKKKVIATIDNKLNYHILNGHALRISSEFNQGIKTPTNLTLNDAILQIMDHLGLAYDYTTGKIVDKASLRCGNEELKAKGKPVSTIFSFGKIHLAAKDADPKLTKVRPAGEITCPKCIEEAEEAGFLD